jgi:hypothetical protein
MSAINFCPMGNSAAPLDAEVVDVETVRLSVLVETIGAEHRQCQPIATESMSGTQ